jgi:glyoxylase-like metal-dependent hydrolase (beta-lactamase superfamily II)
MRNHKINVGGAEIHRVEEMTIRSPMSLLTTDTALIEKNRHWLLPSFMSENAQQRDFVFQSWIVIVDDQVFVIDPCNGNDRPHILPLFNQLNTPYIERFAATGIRPEHVNYVFCTHLHHDHCGWSTQLRNGRFVPTFPNARYIYVKREYDLWEQRRRGDTVDYNTGVFDRSVAPILKAGLGHLVADQYRISPGMDIEPAYGHTLGHSMLHLTSDTQEAYFTGDVFHHPLQILYPELHLPGCDDLSMAIETRRRVARLCATKGALLVPAHFARPHTGYIRAQAETFSFEPLSLTLTTP